MCYGGMCVSVKSSVEDNPGWNSVFYSTPLWAVTRLNTGQQ